MEFRVLGPVEALRDGRPVPLGGQKPRTLLAALLIDHGRVVPVDRLIDVVWDTRPPGSARAVLQTYVSALRQVIMRVDPTAEIVTRPPGYLLRIGPDSLDRDVFERLLDEGRAAAQEDRSEDVVELLRLAAGLWQGTALDGVPSELLSGERLRLDELRLVAAEERVAAELTLGRAAAVSAELTDLVRRHPFREQLRGQLMVALTALGRRSEALAVYRDGRAALVAEMGIEPGPALRALHDRLLREDERSDTSSDAAQRRPRAGASDPDERATTDAGEPAGHDATGGSAPGRARPAQLPPAPADFTGRRDEIRQLVDALSAAPVVGSARVHAIVGKGGIGKSTIALRVAHEVAGRYPDGQLYADLRGVNDSPRGPDEVLSRFLQALGMAAVALPSTLEERTQQFRTLTAGMRLLLILDDACSEGQVRPLLPAAPGCAVLITSRMRLGGIAGVGLTELDMMDPQDSVDLLDRVVGGGRTAEELSAARQIVQHCGGLPLAIRVAGARLAGRQRWPLHLLAARLADERRRLDELTVGDQEVRASIALSYRTLDPEAQKVLRILGVLGLPDFPSWVVSAALGVTESVGEHLIERLVDAQLVDVVRVSDIQQLRYRLHDLVRLFARELAEADDPIETRRRRVSDLGAALIWLVDAAAAVSPSGEFVAQQRPVIAQPALPLAIEQALAEPAAWFSGEHEVLAAMVAVAAGLDLDQLACDLAALLMVPAFPTEKRFAVWTAAHDVALRAAQRADNRYGEAILLYGLGALRNLQDRHDEATEYLCRALESFRRSKDRRGEAASLTALGLTCRERGRFDESLHFLDAAAVLLPEIADDIAVGYVHRHIGSVRLKQGDHARASDHFRQALEAYGRAGSRRGLSLVQRNLSMWHLARGEADEALETARQAAAGAQEVGDQLLTGYCLRTVAKALVRLGRGAAAEEPLRSALGASIRAGDRWGRAATLGALGELHRCEGDLDEAERRIREAVRIWEALSLPLDRAHALRDLALVERARGRHEAAAALRTEVLAVFRQYGAWQHAELLAEHGDGAPEILQDLPTTP
ncbi:BTAD domain-containing putative transcriptional regulator [Micromonospora sp. NPDC005215]|uniref:AfsR/SARP family transcriptional regulator n=1 Tax=Micromonospora sp. NPDC005215 TaxID=3157024 RepID=UPI0033B90D96